MKLTIKPELLDSRMLLLDKIRTLKFIDERMYPVLYKMYPYLFDVEEEAPVEAKKKKK